MHFELCAAVAAVLEAQRLESRTLYDLEMLEQLGFSSTGTLTDTTTLVSSQAVVAERVVDGRIGRATQHRRR